MKYRSLASLLAIGFASRAAAWNHVNETKFQEALDSSGYTLVAFVLPSQEESHALETEWLSMQESENDDNIVSFDCEAHPKKCKELDVASFPSIRVYHRDGRVDRYRGERKGREAARFMKRSLRPPVLEIDAHEAPGVKQMDDIVMIGYLHPQDHNMYDRFYDLARQYRDRYGFVVSPPDEGATRSTVACFNNLDREVFRDHDPATVEGLEDLLKRCAKRVVPVLTQENIEEFETTGKQILHYFATSEDDQDHYRYEVKDLAKKHAESIQFVITYPAEFPRLRPAFGSWLANAELPTLILEDMKAGNVFSYDHVGDEKIAEKDVKAFLDDATGGGDDGGKDESNPEASPVVTIKEPEKVLGAQNKTQERVHEEL